MDPKLQQRIKQYELAVAFAKEFMEELGKEKTLDDGEDHCDHIWALED